MVIFFRKQFLSGKLLKKAKNLISVAVSIILLLYFFPRSFFKKISLLSLAYLPINVCYLQQTSEKWSTQAKFFTY